MHVFWLWTIFVFTQWILINMSEPTQGTHPQGCFFCFGGPNGLCLRKFQVIFLVVFSHLNRKTYAVGSASKLFGICYTFQLSREGQHSGLRKLAWATVVIGGKDVPEGVKLATFPRRKYELKCCWICLDSLCECNFCKRMHLMNEIVTVSHGEFDCISFTYDDDKLN